MTHILLHYTLISLQAAERRGLNTKQVCTECGIDLASIEKGYGEISPEQFCRLWQYLWDALDDEFLGFTEKPCKRGTFSMACKLAYQAPSFNSLFREVTRVYQLVDSDLIVKLEQPVQHEVALSLSNRATHKDIAYFTTEYFLFYWHRFICWVGNEKIIPLRAEFAYPSPKHAEFYSDLFRCPIVFEAERNALIFSDDFPERQPVRSRLELYDFLNQLPTDYMSLPGNTSSIETQIKALILNTSADHLIFPTLDKLAKQFNMSGTTLSRKLSAEKTSYRKIKELIRRDLTMEKLIFTNMTITKIAEEVGFSESTSLARAFKGWTGMTPHQFRGRH